MARRYFGTDGIRGQVGTEPMTVDFALRLASAAARVLAPQGGTVLIGKDTRVSGYMFESALEAGFVAAGVDVLLTGPLPTPGDRVAHEEARRRFRHRHQRLAQPLLRQRHQVLRRRRREAVGRARGSDRGQSRLARRSTRDSRALGQAKNGVVRALRLHGLLQGHDSCRAWGSKISRSSSTLRTARRTKLRRG